jgi:outer membrane protein OmpA-like peptidoglycan-associated protein
MTLRKLFAVAALCTSVAAPAVAGGMSDHTPVYDARNQVIKNTFDNCVRTQWNADGDPCAPPPPPKKAEPKPEPTPAPAPPPKPKISRESRTIYFEFNKSELSPQAITKLNNLIKKIKRSDQIKGAGIAGFADRIGDSKANLELSRKRASINTRILDMRAFGEEQPKSRCDKDMPRKKEIACLREDRRVEVLFIYEE